MTPTQFCQHVENTLGWMPPANVAPYRKYIAEARKVQRAIDTNPTLHTWRNLLLAVELLRREGKSRTPVGVFAHVQRALDLAREELPDVEREIHEAVAYELSREDPQGWAERFARASGIYRRELLEEWKAAPHV